MPWTNQVSSSATGGPATHLPTSWPARVCAGVKLRGAPLCFSANNPLAVLMSRHTPTVTSGKLTRHSPQGLQPGMQLTHSLAQNSFSTYLLHVPSKHCLCYGDTQRNAVSSLPSIVVEQEGFVAVRLTLRPHCQGSNPLSLLSSSVTLGKLLQLSVPWFPRL